MHKVRFCSTAAVAVFILALASPLMAQQYLGTLSGQVKDASGASVANAQVTATDVVTHFETKSVTNDSGSFSIPFLTPDEYTLSVAGKGFRPETKTGVTLTAGGSVNMDFALTVGVGVGTGGGVGGCADA